MEHQQYFNKEYYEKYIRNAADRKHIDRYTISFS